MYQVLHIRYLWNIKLFLLFILSTSYFIFNTAPTTYAQIMSNNNYIIKMQGFNTISGVTEGNDYQLRSTTGGQSPTTSEGVNFKVKTGFESLNSSLPFSFLLSSDIVDFGILSPTNPIIRTVDLNINSLNAYGYSVITWENEPLSTLLDSAKVYISDTTCDNGKCDAQEAAEWINTLTYGFGYRCDNLKGLDCNNGFKPPNYYKHFPDVISNDSPESIMSGIGSNNRQTRISYKVNVSGNQAQGVYKNIVTYIAIPNY